MSLSAETVTLQRAAHDREVFDEPLAEETRRIIAFWDSVSFTPEQQEAINEFWNAIDNSYPLEYVDE